MRQYYHLYDDGFYKYMMHLGVDDDDRAICYGTRHIKLASFLMSASYYSFVKGSGNSLLGQEESMAK